MAERSRHEEQAEDDRLEASAAEPRVSLSYVRLLAPHVGG